ncbi:methyl-accepting chemotaxis protein [Halovivax sp.]|uniref:methyl-accepting chemotaxis protein n=1 Tax=Halovivax sp. TaxID=1935978 RepID=UPI0025BB3974|nr:methyl-accepting chemotaxis protein [Halovivax sp.]
MTRTTLVPDRIRRRYTAKLSAVLAAVIVLTLAIAALFAFHVSQTAQDGQVPLDAAIAAVSGLAIVFFLHLGVVGIVLGGNVSLSLRQLAEKTEPIGAGELDVDLETDRVDEIGTLYGAVAAMRDSLAVTLEDLETQRERAIDARRETERRAEALSAEAERFSEEMAACAAGDLDRRLEPRSDDEAMTAIADSFNEMVDDLGTTVGRVKRFAETVDEAAAEVQSGAREIREANREVASSIQEISDGSASQTDDLEAAAGEINDLSATIEELAATASTIADQSRRVARLADTGRADATDAAGAIRDAEERTERVAETIRRLNDDAEKIEEVIELIDDIAGQTNMLALNASIESARNQQDVEGKDGGFDAVAGQVKELAQETKEAVDEVEESLQSIQEDAAASAAGIGEVEREIDTAAGAVEDLHTQLEEISGDIDRVDEGVQSIDRTTDDQATSTSELATIVDDVASVSAETTAQAEDVAAASEEATATSDEVYGEAESLAERADRLAQAVAVFSVAGESNDTVAADGGERR